MGNTGKGRLMSGTVRMDREQMYSSLENTMNHGKSHKLVSAGNVSMRPQTAVFSSGLDNQQHRKSTGRATFVIKESGTTSRNLNDSVSLVSNTRRARQMGNLLDMLSQQCHSTRKTSSLVRIDTKHLDKENCLSETEVMRVFQARNTDLQLGAFFDQQFMRFREYCSKKCINRKVIFDDVSAMVIN